MANKINEALSWRYATKRFDPAKKLSDEQRTTILEAIRLAPTSFGLQNFKIVVVRNEELKTKLREAAYGQPQVTDSDMFLVYCVQNNVSVDDIEAHANLVGKVRNLETDKTEGLKKMLMGFIQDKPAEDLSNWATKQLYISLGFGLLAAAGIGVDACPMEGFDHAKFDEILELPEKGLKSVCAMAVGFRSPEDKTANMPKVRKAKEEIFLEI